AEPWSCFCRESAVIFAFLAWTAVVQIGAAENKHAGTESCRLAGTAPFGIDVYDSLLSEPSSRRDAPPLCCSVAVFSIYAYSVIVNYGNRKKTENHANGTLAPAMSQARRSEGAGFVIESPDIVIRAVLVGNRRRTIPSARPCRPLPGTAWTAARR